MAGSIKGFLDWVKGEEIGGYEEDDPDLQQDTRGQKRDSRQRSEDMPATSGSSYDTSDSSASPRRSSGRVVNINNGRMTVLLMKPDRFEKAQELADQLKDKHTILLLNLVDTPPEVTRRLVDFLIGVAYAQDGKLKPIADKTYIITPQGVDLSGDFEDADGHSVYF